MEREEIWAKQLEMFLVEHQWGRRICENCGLTFFAKERNETKTCRRGKCSHNPKDFLAFSKHRVPSPLSSIEQALWNGLATSNCKISSAVDVTATLGNTELIGAGIQVFEPVFFGREPPPKGPLFVMQPSIRMRNLGRSKEVEGNSSAFVNVCTLEIGCTFESHLKKLDAWIETLSNLGLFMGDVTLLRRVSDEDWGNGPFRQFEIFIMYGSLELGDASFGFQATREQGVLPVSDIGFGLERIAWAVSKLPTYFDLLRPVTFGLSFGKNAHDALRTASLLMLCGVEASNKGVGFHLRKICRFALTEGVRGLDSYEVLLHYYIFWSRFLEGKRSFAQVIAIFRRETERIIQSEIANKLKVPKAEHETVEVYANRLVYNLGVSISDIQELLAQKNYE